MYLCDTRTHSYQTPFFLCLAASSISHPGALKLLSHDKVERQKGRNGILGNLGVCVYVRMSLAATCALPGKTYIAHQSNELRSSVSRRPRRRARGQSGVGTISIPLPSLLLLGYGTYLLHGGSACIEGVVA